MDGTAFYFINAMVDFRVAQPMMRDEMMQSRMVMQAMPMTSM